MNPNGAFVLLPLAHEDLREHAAYPGRHNPDKAVEFFAATRETFGDLAASPFLGSPQFFGNPQHHSLRRWPVRNHPRYLVFYRPFASGDSVEI